MEKRGLPENGEERVAGIFSLQGFLGVKRVCRGKEARVALRVFKQRGKRSHFVV